MWNWLVAFVMSLLAAHGPAFTADFATYPDGPPAGFALHDNGADTRYTPAASPGLEVVDGALQTTATGRGLAAGYASVDMGAPVTRIGARFGFTDGDPRGAIALPVWAEPIGQTWPRIPDSPAHVVVSRADWAYQVYEGGRLVSLAQGVFVPPLLTGVPLSVDVRLDGATATVALPDGSTATVTDPRIAVPARFACWEAFVMDAATMSRPLITRVWADT